MVRLRIYSITLLLSFLIIISHELIPHHHHDGELDEISVFHDHQDEDGNHNAHRHEHESRSEHDSEKSDKKSHNHFPFPYHNHLVDQSDFNCIRLTLKKNTSFNTHLVLYSFIWNFNITKPPQNDFTRLPDISLPLNSLSAPGAVSLRAPPLMA